MLLEHNSVHRLGSYSPVTKGSGRKVTHLAIGRVSGHFRGSQGCVGRPAWGACDCVGSLMEDGDPLLPGVRERQRQVFMWIP